jgi:SAM-dependent methyltransferase
MLEIDYLNRLRTVEVDRIVRYLEPGARILELGAGTGRQALDLSARGFRVDAVEIGASNYAGERLFPIVEYDGRHIPFPDATFDIVFSSNVLEHVVDLQQIYSEIRRTLRPGGYCLHVLPTHTWRFWSTLSAFPVGFEKAFKLSLSLFRKATSLPRKLFGLLAAPFVALGYILDPLFQRRHGERGNLVSELWLFHPSWWRRNFRSNGFEIVRDEPMGLFYTGHALFGASTSFDRRARWARYLGSACHLFQLRIASAPVSPRVT